MISAIERRHVFTFPSMHNKKTSPGMSDCESRMSASDDDLVKEGATSLNSKHSTMEATNLFHHSRQKQIVEFKKAAKVEMLAAGDVQPKSKTNESHESLAKLHMTGGAYVDGNY